MDNRWREEFLKRQERWIQKLKDADRMRELNWRDIRAGASRARASYRLKKGLPTGMSNIPKLTPQESLQLGLPTGMSNIPPEDAATKKMFDEQMRLNQKRWAKQSLERDMLSGKEPRNLNSYQKFDPGKVDELPKGTIKFHDSNPLTTETPYGTAQVNLGQNNKTVDAAKDAATKFTPSEVRRMTSGLRYNEGVGRWTAPRNSIRLMKANQEGLRPAQSVAKVTKARDQLKDPNTIGRGLQSLPQNQFIPSTSVSWANKVGNLAQQGVTNYAPVALGDPKVWNTAFSDAASFAGSAAGNAALDGLSTGISTGATSTAGGAGTNAMGVSLAIKAGRLMLAKLLDPHANKQILPAKNNPGVAAGNEDLWSSFLA